MMRCKICGKICKRDGKEWIHARYPECFTDHAAVPDKSFIVTKEGKEALKEIGL